MHIPHDVGHGSENFFLWPSRDWLVKKIQKVRFAHIYIRETHFLNFVQASRKHEMYVWCIYIYAKRIFSRAWHPKKTSKSAFRAYIYARNEFFDDFLGGHTFPIRTYPTPFFHLMPRVTGCPLRENNLQKCFKKPFLGLPARFGLQNGTLPIGCNGSGNNISGFCKNTETRNIFMPSYEIFAPSCEIIMKTVKYCRKIIKNHEKITK